MRQRPPLPFKKRFLGYVRIFFALFFAGSRPAKRFSKKATPKKCPKIGSKTARSQEAVIAQLGERQTEDLKVPCSIHGHGTILAWMNSEGSGHGLQTHGGLTSQWFESTFCALFFFFFSSFRARKKKWRSRVSIPVPHACKACALPFELHPQLHWVRKPRAFETKQKSYVRWESNPRQQS